MRAPVLTPLTFRGRVRSLLERAPENEDEKLIQRALHRSFSANEILDAVHHAAMANDVDEWTRLWDLFKLRGP